MLHTHCSRLLCVAGINTDQRQLVVYHEVKAKTETEAAEEHCLQVCISEVAWFAFLFSHSTICLCLAPSIVDRVLPYQSLSGKCPIDLPTS